MATGELVGGQLSAIEGKDDWLFLKSFGSQDILSFYTEANSPPEAAIDRWVDVAERRHAWFARRGIPFVSIFAPDNCLVYPEALPDHVRLNGNSPFARFAAKLSPAARAEIVYPLQTLIDGRGRFDTCQRTDSHWSEWGAYLAYRDLIAHIRKQVPGAHLVEHDDIEWRLRHSFGAMGVVMTPERSEEIPVARLKAQRSRYVRIAQTEVRDAYTVTQIDDPALPTAVVFRDSYATAMAPFLIESFRRAVFVSCPNAVFYDLVEQEKPDVVIFERAERAFSWPPTEPDYLDFRSMFGDLLLDTKEAITAQKRSRSLAREKKLAEAMAASDEALAVAPRDRVAYSRALVHRARLLELLGDRAAAFEALRHAMTLEPEGALPLAAAARLRVKEGRHAEAAQLAHRAAAAEPGVPNYHELSATCLEHLGDKAAAAAALEAAVAIDRMRLSPLLTLCRLRREAGDMDAARAHAEAALRLDPLSRVTLATLANILVAQSDWAAGKAILERAVAAHPKEDLFQRFLVLCDSRLASARRAAAAVPAPVPAPAKDKPARRAQPKGRRK